jgi:hypothetical protein
MAENFSRQANAEAGVLALTGRATLGATIGNMLEFYDFVTYSFFAIQIGRTFFPSHSQSSHYLARDFCPGLLNAPAAVYSRSILRMRNSSSSTSSCSNAAVAA